MRTVEVVLPSDPDAAPAAQRLLRSLRTLLGDAAVLVLPASTSRTVGSNDARIDLNALRGAQPRGRFSLPTPQSERWAIEARADGRQLVVAVSSGGMSGAQLAVNELLDLAGVRALSYNHLTHPEFGTLRLPDAGSQLEGAITDRFRYRGMAPHTYHPIELSQALHDPGPRSQQILRDYVDWNVATGQNVVHFPLLDVEADNVALRLTSHPARRATWDAHVRDLVTYAHERGVQVVANASFTVFTDAHLRAMGSVGATVDTFRLNGRQHDWLSSPVGSKQRERFLRSYEKLLTAITERHAPPTTSRPFCSTCSSRSGECATGRSNCFAT